MQADIHICYRPAAPLDRFVDRLWYWEGVPPEQARHRIMPDGCACLIVNLFEDEVRDYTGANDATLVRYRGAVLVGAYSRYSVIDTQEQRAVLGVTFRPGGMAPFFAPAADELINANVDLRDVWGSDGSTLRERVLLQPTPQRRLRLVEHELLRRACRPLHRRAEIDFLLAQLSARPELSIATLAGQAGLSARRVTRLFALETGLTPKLYARIRRFDRVLRMLETVDLPWIDLAQHCGYFDQSHLINECRALSGCTPSELRARRIGTTRHVII
ncbi:MAG TPA: AraC family transcriptional regulator [Povalibacter sp.]|nr:AraC family transcriptional regulator [Povalibacter sp.]